MSTDEQPEQPVQAIGGGYWREDGTFQAPPGWPEGAGWVVKNPDGTIARWGPATDLKLIASVGDGSPADPGEYSMSPKGLPQLEEPAGE
jgi:hypothetical protein